MIEVRAESPDPGVEQHPLPIVEISPHQARVMKEVITAIEEVIGLPAYQQAVLAYAGPTARHHPGPLGGLLGYDFHLGPHGPSLIEINTNAGGIMLCGELGKPLGRQLLHMFLDEWQLSGKTAPLASVAIVDETPREQFLYPEFLAIQSLLRQHGISAHIAAPDQLDYRDGKLWLDGHTVDLLYNRLTDFALERPEHAPLRQAYLEDAVALTPHPHAHALYADKRNMTLLGDENLLADLGVPVATRKILESAIPPTRTVTSENADTLWRERRQLYFKPARGYGSRGVYRGEKLTKRVWDSIRRGSYVAQLLIPPSRIPGPEGELKVDLRHYVYGGHSLLLAARLYRGQTTNLRTPGGGFAQVREIRAA